MPWKAFCKQVSEAGYAGIETPIPFDEAGRNEIREALDEYGLLLIGQYYQSFEKDFEAHQSNYRLHLENLRLLNCVLIDAQTGKDYYSTAQNVALFEMAARFSAESGIRVAHETHRNKALYAAHRFGELLQGFPDLQITADFSHWCCVSESLLEQQEDAVKLAISRTIHIHSRVGYEESPQVPDPRAPEYRQAFEAHLRWWDEIIVARRNEGCQHFTITPEFGPPPYMQTVPFSQTPLAGQWEINLFMMQYLEERYCNEK
jgi:sugar phosphate isomerase/epimerase